MIDKDKLDKLKISSDNFGWGMIFVLFAIIFFIILFKFPLFVLTILILCAVGYGAGYIIENHTDWQDK